MQLVQEKQDG
jgi:hypothetical protein